MSKQVVMNVYPGGLRAANHAEAAKLDSLVGKQVECKISVPRNLAFHRKYYAMLRTSIDMIPDDYNLDQFRAVCTVGAGYCEFIESQGQLVAVPKSISFASMDETTFGELYQDTLTYICGRWAIDEEFLNNLLEFM